MRTLIASALFALALATPAVADKRVALVIGNAGYENVTRLANPSNDADAITETLKKAGFDVVESRRDLKINETRRVLRDFSDKARDSDMAVIYYAGHGIEVDGVNYLIPVDAALERDADVFDEAIALDRILITIEPAKKLRLVILDACRDNPFARKMKRTLASRAIGRGFAKVEPNSPNTLIAFAAKAGSTASDGDSRNSPFTAALVKHIATPGLDLRKAFGFVRDEVLKQTSNKQEPFVYGSLGGNDVSLVPAPAVVVTPPAPAASVNNEIRRDYELASQVGSIDAFDTFIAAYPSGFYTELAKAQRRKLIAEAARLEATEKARLAAEERERLASENARKKEQDEAAARARAAEQARLAAEKAKRDEETKVAAAEKVKAEAQARLAEQERLAAEKAKRDEQARLAAADKARAEAEAKLAEQQRLAAERLRQAEEKAAAAKAAADKVAADKAAAEAAAAKTAADKAATEKALADKAAAAAEPAPEKPAGETKLAALAPPASPDPAPKAESINRQLQSELRRVGCYSGTVNDEWSGGAQRSLEQFNKRAGLKLNVKLASIDALDAVKGKSSRVCPLICQHGYKAEGEKCVEIVCKAGFEVGDNNTCERIPPKKPPPAATAKRDEPAKRDEAPAAKREEPKQQKQAAPTGQRIICTQAGCREIAKNCRLERLPQGNTSQDRMSSLSGVREVCN